MSIPNIITFGRLLAVPLIIYLILRRDLGWAFWLFVAAGISDGLDGAIARMCQMRTKLGGYLDPIADKTLLVSVYPALAWIDALPLWLAILVVSRDLMIVGGFGLAVALKEPLAMQPLAISKINTAMQIALVAVILSPPGLLMAGIDLTGLTLFGLPPVESVVGLTALTTILSGAAYVWRGWLVFERHGGVE